MSAASALAVEPDVKATSEITDLIKRMN